MTDSRGIMAKLRSHLACLVDPATSDDTKLKGAQDVSENLENFVNSPHYSSFLETAIPIFLQLLKDGEPQFLTDSSAQQLRKLVLELIHRLPANDNLKGHVKALLSTMFSLLEVENEENVLICLKVIIELHKQFRPSYSPEITKFLQFVKLIYTDLPKTMSSALETQEPEGMEVSSTSSTVTPAAAAPGGGASEASKNPSVLPKASSSLKVLAELPIIVVLMYQLYKQSVHQWVADLIPLTIKTITLQPSDKARLSAGFNKEVYVDFVAVQIKFLSFLAYIIRIYQDVVNQFAPNMVQGMLALLKNCPQEVAHLRRELLIAARHVLATDLRTKFVPCIDQLFDESLLVGTGWTTRDTVRSLAYSILADLVHHIRSNLSLPQLSSAVHLFSKNVHDDTFPVSIQTMSCKLLLNLVECIRQISDQDLSGRDVLMRMMEVFVLKFQSIAQYQIPDVLEKCHPQSEMAALAQEMATNGSHLNGPEQARRSSNTLSVGSSLPFATPSNGSSHLMGFSLPDCRAIVKTLVCGMKTITWGAGSCRLPGSAVDYASQPQKTFQSHETEVFLRLLKYGLMALDIYRVTMLPNGVLVLRNSNCQTVKTKEEKEVLEHFAGIYTMLATPIFKEIFSEVIEYLVERVQNNYALQIIPNSFLANATTSATFAGILLDFLLKRMEDLGANNDKSNLYLKMFKLVFGSVTLFAQENELMLKPHLHEIVNRSMSLANTCKEPCNYFLLLRALFRSIGGGSHELLYQEFLPLLSNLLQGLNRLQSAQHRQYMKDLFVELCLTVPVRLSSLLPYLHLLMDPLVSALNGSQTLISQGLRTLELCVDNLQPDFLYEHIQPVRAQLMQALWQTLHNPDENIAQVAFRVLGKFGGSNRKMLTSPQQLEYNENLIDGPAILISFPDAETPVEIPVAKAVEVAVKLLKPHSTDPFYRQQAWILLQSYLISVLNLSDADKDLYQLLNQVHYQPMEFNANRLKHISLPQCTNKIARNAFETALKGVFIASCLRDLRNEAVVFLAGIVRQIISVAVVQQCSSSSFLKSLTPDTMDVYVLLEAIAKCVASEEKELYRIAELALTFVVDTAATIIGDREKATELPLFEVAVEKLCGCCYERAWYAKSGGCWAIGFFLDKMPLKWVINHQLTFLMALLFVLHDLSNEVSSGTVIQAQELIDKMLKLCNSTLSEENKANLEPAQSKSFSAVTRHIVKEIITPNEAVRKQAHSSLLLLKEVTGRTVASIIEPHKELLIDMIPPKKHLLKHQPINTQIALMDGYTFCCNLSPRLFSINLSVPEHKVFFQELITLCGEGDDAALAKSPCYKGVQSLVPLKISGLAALAACTYLTEMRERIFGALYKAINSNSVELQNAGKEAMRKFMSDTSQSDIELVHSALRPLLMMLGDFRNLNPTLLQRLTHMVELFPTSFNEKMCESLLAHLKRWVEVIVNNSQSKPVRRGEEVQVCILILDMFHMLPASSFKLFDPLISLCIKAEKALGTELSSPFREPLLKFTLRFTSLSMEFFLSHLSDITISRILQYFLKHKDGKPLKEHLYSNPQKLIDATFRQPAAGTDDASIQKKAELQYQGISLFHFLLEEREEWIKDKGEVIKHLKAIWLSDSYHSLITKDAVPLSHWQECSMLVNCLLLYCKYHKDDIETLFYLLKVFMFRHVTSFPFLKSYLENEVAKQYTIEQKRAVFFKFVEIFSLSDYLQELKAKILQYILIPVFTFSFEEGERDELLGGPPDPERDSDTNIISVFISKVINPDKPFGSSDSVCILLLQFSSLLVEHAAPHIHDSNNKKQGAKLRRLMTFAWPCLLPKQCVDPATKYHGHLLLAHIISKFAIHKRIVLQVFHSLLKAHAIEARAIVRQALDILTPVVPVRMEDANATLVHWTKKIIVEEGQTMAQLIHILQLLCRHYKVYYPVRQHLVQHMVSSMQRLGLTSNATLEQRRLAVDLTEVIIKWEFQRAKEAQEMDGEPMEIMKDTASTAVTSGLGLKRSGSDGTAGSGNGGGGGAELKRQRSQAQVADPTWPLDKQHADSIINFLIRLACQVNDTQVPGNATSPNPAEQLSKRCVSLIRTALKPDLWPSIDVKLSWFGKLLETISQVDPSNAAASNSTYVNVCTALEILLFLINVLPPNVLLSGFKSLNRGLHFCMTSNNTKVVRYLHSFLSRLIKMFTSELVSGPGHDELDQLYSNLQRTVFEGLTTYEKASTSASTNLNCTLMILKACCVNDPTYIDKFLVPFVKVMQKLHKEHLLSSNSTAEIQTVSELLQLSIDMCKLRVTAMPQDCRKAFFNILTSLIEKSTDIKLLKSIARTVDDWVKNRYDLPSHSGPSIREKSLLLSRMMSFFEKRFPDDLELMAMFLDTVLFVYKDDHLSSNELTAKLEPAFLCGLRCPQVSIRTKFFEVFERSVQQRLYDRLLYIMCSQNWEHCGGHFWIKQCIELIISVGNLEMPLKVSPMSPVLPCISSICPTTTPLVHDVSEPPTITSQLPEELMEGVEGEGGEGGGVGALEKLTNKLVSFLSDCKNIQTQQFAMPLAQLCHESTSLAHHVWINLFPKIWSALPEQHRQALSGEVSPFLCSAAHLIQMDCHPSAIGTFLEAVLSCKPTPHIRSCLLKYLGKIHNYWNGSLILLEDRAKADGELSMTPRDPPPYDGNYNDELLDPFKNETMNALSELYALLNEEDMWTGLWTLRSRFPETRVAIAYECQGLYSQAQEHYEKAMSRARELHNVGPAPPSMIPEYKLWEEHWCKCSRELCKWDVLNDFGKAHGGTNPFLVLENAWRVQDWSAMREASTQAEPICSESYSARLNLLRGFLALCYPDEQRLNAVEKLVEAASIQSVKQWRRLPHIVSNSHIPLLQLSQQIIELQEATQIHSGLQSGSLSRQSFLNEVKTIFKTWKNRLPNHFDDLSYWSDIFLWREQHFRSIIKAYDGTSHGEQSNQAMLAVHHLAGGITQFSSIARKQKLITVSLDSLSRIHNIPSVPVVDLFQKIRQQVKCYLMTASTMEPSEIQEAFDFIESTNLKYFSKEMVSEFLALKGTFLIQYGKSEEANKCFSAAVQLHDGLYKAWALWGDFLDQLFAVDKNITLAVSALTCFLHACRHQSEPKSRKYLARTIWILSYDDEKRTLAEALDKYYMGIPPMHWLPWIPQLLTCLVRNEGSHILNLLCSVGKAYPQAIYFPIRTLYLTLKIEQKEKFKAEVHSSHPPPPFLRSTSQPGTPNPPSASDGVEPMQVDSAHSLGKPPDSQVPPQTPTESEAKQPKPPSTPGATVPPLPSGDSSMPSESAPFRAPASLWRCSRIMHLLRDLHPTLLSALEGIVDQLIWFRESWYEDLLRQLNEGLVACYEEAFENRGDIASVRIKPEMFQYVQKLVSSFGITAEQSNMTPGAAGTGNNSSQEALTKRAQAAAQDPAFQRLKNQFDTDFDFSSPGPKRLSVLITKLKRWIKILELKTKSLQKSFLLEDRCRFLSNFSLNTADVEMPGEHLELQTMPYYVKIARFMPRVEIVQKHNTTVRRLYIQGDNGKIYPYLVLNDVQASKNRREERVLQLFRLLNYSLKKEKETCKRHLQFSVPKVVALSPQMRLLEDDVSILSLSDIFKQYCNSQNQDWDILITLYYERLAALQTRGEKINLTTIKNMFSQIQMAHAPTSIIRDWAEKSCASLTDFWTLRKQITRQLALVGLAEFVFHLSRLDLEMFQISRSSGCLTQTFYKFEINNEGALDANRAVPFRLTPNIQSFLSPIGISGPLYMSMVAVARVLVQPQYSIESILLALFRDEFIAWSKRKQEEAEGHFVSLADVSSEMVTPFVNDAVDITLTRLFNLADFETGKSQVSTLISAASNLDNICRMDPAWNPWL
ncbi:PREDICTED: transformation/transcription domain-associated protein [Amphimedon queenslandica]|nr:PREDICTED: transformation/transcription domain-associated protein [Amphimedon queenslandica]|eukprot:XP_019851030.1 PREDICTED: transformation/transcription domain-associated protein [Amphimedon queenslandica]